MRGDCTEVYIDLQDTTKCYITIDEGATKEQIANDLMLAAKALKKAAKNNNTYFFFDDHGFVSEG